MLLGYNSQLVAIPLRPGKPRLSTTLAELEAEWEEVPVNAGRMYAETKAKMMAFLMRAKSGAGGKVQPKERVGAWNQNQQNQQKLHSKQLSRLAEESSSDGGDNLVDIVKPSDAFKAKPAETTAGGASTAKTELTGSKKRWQEAERLGLSRLNRPQCELARTQDYRNEKLQEARRFQRTTFT
ncbi:predicted protein [Sclerotinia sclerotiorum 1980 UF-70]|uniref:Uncharacterized protein n=1 Tax=Sclerotinia sclerotiorum (strain ATCC 18683 / 1980 / Ss-1) TaxID=665079 RepID=A7ESN5_SCLS1|nr:predicted protein [Sclerotinia sclerotiorum 1980 UF-70]EDN92477.1 predicted protein [Sclerotinia sclerotiorum 1980 UF-70]